MRLAGTHRRPAIFAKRAARSTGRNANGIASLFPTSCVYALSRARALARYRRESRQFVEGGFAYSRAGFEGLARTRLWLACRVTRVTAERNETHQRSSERVVSSPSPSVSQ